MFVSPDFPVEVGVRNRFVAACLGSLLHGITVNTSPTDFRPIKHIRMLRFDGQRWNYFGPIMTE